MHTKNIRLFIVLALSLFIISCSKDAADEPQPPSNPNPVTCNIGTVTFSTTISGLLTSYGCVGCHSGPAPSGNFSLQGYNNVKAKINDGRLWGAINHQSGFAAMPQGGSKMNDCDISKVKAWIDAGAPNN